MLSRGHLDLAGIFISLIRFFLNLCIPAQAIIAALSPQNFISGNKALNPISFESLRIFSRIELLAATPPATTKLKFFIFGKTYHVVRLTFAPFLE